LDRDIFAHNLGLVLDLGLEPLASLTSLVIIDRSSGVQSSYLMFCLHGYFPSCCIRQYSSQRLNLTRIVSTIGVRKFTKKEEYMVIPISSRVTHQMSILMP